MLGICSDVSSRSDTICTDTVSIYNTIQMQIALSCDKLYLAPSSFYVDLSAADCSVFTDVLKKYPCSIRKKIK